MKKYILLIALATILPTTAFAQLKVNSSGNVGIHTDPHSNYSLKVDGDTYFSGKTTHYGQGQGTLLSLSSFGTITSPSMNKIMTLTNSINTTKSSIGLFAIQVNESDSSRSNINILHHTKGGKKCQRSIGVSGGIGTNNFGTGVLGLVGGLLDPVSSINIGGCYAGFFQGNVKVTGTITGTLVSESDGRLKENITDMGEGQNYALSKLSLLSPVSYQYKNAQSDDTDITDDLDLIEELDSIERNLYMKEKDDSSFFAKQQQRLAEKTHFGFVAQELQKVYPELVYEQDNGYLAINYVELIPVLVQSIKELNAKVEELSAPRPTKAQAMNATTDVEAEDFYSAAMGQNVPNPFFERTEIAITLPESVKKAMLYIYDMTGKQVEQHEVEGRGKTTMTIYADSMNAGMYIYALIADGKVVTSKKMIVTK